MYCRRKQMAAKQKKQVLQLPKQIFRPITSRAPCWGKWQPTVVAGLSRKENTVSCKGTKNSYIRLLTTEFKVEQNHWTDVNLCKNSLLTVRGTATVVFNATIINISSYWWVIAAWRLPRHYSTFMFIAAGSYLILLAVKTGMRWFFFFFFSPQERLVLNVGASRN